MCLGGPRETLQQVITPGQSSSESHSGLEGDMASQSWDSLLWDVPLQNWLTPATLPWSEWTSILSHEPPLVTA